MSGLDLRLLGPVGAAVDGRAVPLGPRQQRLILALLALEANRLVPVERLVELVWPDPPRTAAHAIQVCVSRLRSLLGSAAVRFDGGRSGYLLRADPDCVDAHRFRRLLEQAREADGGTRVALLDRALALWSGPALADVAAPEVRERLCRGLEEARLAAQEDRIDARLNLGQHAEVLDELIGLVAQEPVRERLIGQLMLALYRGGRTGDALRVYQQARRRLADDLGLDPGPELRRLEVAILRGTPAARPGRNPAPPDRREAAAPVRVVLVDDHPMFRSGLRLALESDTGITVVADAGGLADALDATARTAPDVVVMDLHLPDGSGIEGTRLLAARGGRPAVLVLTMSEEDEAITAALAAGARGYLMKSAGREEIISAVRAVAAGTAVFSSGVADRLTTLSRAAGPDRS